MKTLINIIQAFLWGAAGFFLYKEELPFVFGCLLFTLVDSVVLAKVVKDEKSRLREWGEILVVTGGVFLVWVETFWPEIFDLMVFNFSMAVCIFFGVLLNIGHLIAWIMRLILRLVSVITNLMQVVADFFEWLSGQASPSFLVVADAEE